MRAETRSRRLNLPYRILEQVTAEYDATSHDQERERREFIDRLARGDV